MGISLAVLSLEFYFDFNLFYPPGKLENTLRHQFPVISLTQMVNGTAKFFNSLGSQFLGLI